MLLSAGGYDVPDREIHVLDKLHSNMSYSVAGLEFNVNVLTTYIK